MTTPANSSASQQTRDLLGFIHSLSGKSEHCVLSGQFIRWNHNASLEELAGVHAKTGRWVAIAAGDYYTNDQKVAHPINYRLTNDVLVGYARAGGLVSVSIHMNNPLTGGPAWDSNIDLQEVITHGSKSHSDWLAQMKQVADGLDELRRSGFVVLFRPYHEMTGGWFWWGGKDPSAFKTLWQTTFRYLSQDRGLDNLLWLYTPAAGVGDMLQFYPGDQFVDLVGFDAYTPDPADLRSNYESLLSTGKPFGFGEYGPMNGGAKAADPDRPYNWSRFARSLREDFPLACYFITWRDHWGLNQHDDPGALLKDPRVLNRS